MFKWFKKATKAGWEKRVRKKKAPRKKKDKFLPVEQGLVYKLPYKTTKLFCLTMI